MTPSIIGVAASKSSANFLIFMLSPSNFKLPILSKSEYHYLIDTEEFELHPDSNEDSIIVYEYTSSLLEISKELILNNISFEHHVSKDV